MKYTLRLSAIISIMCLTFIQVSASPDSKRVKGIIGRCEITRHITQEQAEQKALEDAKTNAMRAAGVPEQLWSVTGLISEDDGSEFSQVLSRMTTLAVDGFITVREAVYSEEMINGRRYAVATIDADVRKGSGIDPTFALDIKGIDAENEEGETMTFTTRIYGHDAYLKIFWFSKNEGALVYPSDYEADRLFKKDFDYTFPINPAIEYVMDKLEGNGRFMTLNFIAVATKKDIPFLEKEITFDTVLHWIYSIPADERAAYRESILIQ